MARDIYAEEGLAPPSFVPGKDIYKEEGLAAPNIMAEPFPERDWGGEIAARTVAGVADVGQNLVRNAQRLVGLPLKEKEDFSALLANISGEKPKQGFLPEAIEGLASSLPLLGPAKLFSGVSRLPLLARALAPAAAEGAIAAATSEDPLTAGVLGATVGGLAPILNSLRGSVVAKNIDNAYSKMGQNILDNYQAERQKYQNLYKNILSQGDEARGSAKFVFPKELSNASEDIDYLLSKLPRDKTIKLKNFVENPSLQTAHEAQSSLGKTVSQIGNKVVKTDLDSELLPITQQMRSNIQAAIDANFNKLGKPGLAQQYRDIGAGYRENVIPFNTKAMRDYQAGNISEKTLAKKMMSSEAFQMKNPYQNIQQEDVWQSPLLREILSKSLVGGATAAGAGAVGVPLYYWMKQ